MIDELRAGRTNREMAEHTLDVCPPESKQEAKRDPQMHVGYYDREEQVKLHERNRRYPN
jgi:hypothetical protein